MILQLLLRSSAEVMCGSNGLAGGGEGGSEGGFSEELEGFSEALLWK